MFHPFEKATPLTEVPSEATFMSKLAFYASCATITATIAAGAAAIVTLSTGVMLPITLALTAIAVTAVVATIALIYWRDKLDDEASHRVNPYASP
jgi:hypothetical protein